MRSLARLAELHGHLSSIAGAGGGEGVFQVCQRNVPNALVLQPLADVEPDRSRAIAGEENSRTGHGTESIRQILAELVDETRERRRDGRAGSSGPRSDLICAIHGGRGACRLQAETRCVRRQVAPVRADRGAAVDVMHGGRIVDGIEEGEGVEQRLLARAELFEVVVERPVGWVRPRYSASGRTRSGPALIPGTRRQPHGHRDGGRGADAEQ